MSLDRSCALLLACAALAHATPPAVDDRPTQRALRQGGAIGSLPPLATSPSSGSGARSTAHSFDFWAEAEPIVSSQRAADVVCADLDGDGWPELARLAIEFGNPYGGNLEIARGGPYGPTDVPTPHAFVPSPRCLSALDLNGDGRMDLLAAHLVPVPGVPNVFERVATAFVSTGAPGIDFLSPPPRWSLPNGGELVAIADVDGDHVDDLISAGTGHEVFYQRGLGLVGASPAVPDFAGQAVSLSQLVAQTAGLPAGATFPLGFVNALAVGDFDFDGTCDVAVAAGSALGGGVHLHFRRPAGWVYQGHVVPDSTGQGALTFTGLAAADLDGDGALDLVASATHLDVTTLLNNGPSSAPAAANDSVGMRAHSSPNVGRNAIALSAADIDNDGRVDLAFLDPLQQRVCVVYSPGGAAPAGTFVDSPAYFAGIDFPAAGPRQLSVVDLDGDTDRDLVATFLLGPTTALLHNQRLPNARKPATSICLRGLAGGGVLSNAFQPDATAFEQRPTPGGASHLAIDRFRFQASPAMGSSLHLRLHWQAQGHGVRARLGLVERSTGRLRWVHREDLDMSLRETLIDLPDASRFTDAAGGVDVVIASRGADDAFTTSIDQLSVELR